MTSAGLDELLHHPSVWRASSAEGAPKTLPTGFRRLDERLPGGGWPLDTLIELLLPAHGVGELNLLVPALRELGNGVPGPRRWIAWIEPPHLPYAPALAGAGLDPARMLIVQPRGRGVGPASRGTQPGRSAGPGTLGDGAGLALRRLRRGARLGGCGGQQLTAAVEACGRGGRQPRHPLQAAAPRRRTFACLAAVAARTARPLTRRAGPEKPRRHAGQGGWGRES